MGGFVVHERASPEKIRAEAAEAIRDVCKWFERHPRRRVCVLGVWYDRVLNIKRKTIAEQINRAAEEAIK